MSKQSREERLVITLKALIVVLASKGMIQPHTQEILLSYLKPDEKRKKEPSDSSGP